MRCGRARNAVNKRINDVMAHRHRAIPGADCSGSLAKALEKISSRRAASGNGTGDTSWFFFFRLGNFLLDKTRVQPAAQKRWDGPARNRFTHPGHGTFIHRHVRLTPVTGLLGLKSGTISGGSGCHPKREGKAWRAQCRNLQRMRHPRPLHSKVASQVRCNQSSHGFAKKVSDCDQRTERAVF